MELRHIFLLLIVALLVIVVRCQLDDIVHMFKSQNTKKIYCGAHLAKTLSAVCKGNYNTFKYRRRPQRDLHQNIDYVIGMPFREKASATTLISEFRRRRRRGVFNECCEKPCSREELSTYCGPVSRRRK